MSESKHLDLIAKMLRKAEGTTNEHEAAAFMERAQTLATRHSIDLAIARSHTAKAENREQVEERKITIGAKGKHGLAKYVRLFLNIGGVNNLKFLISQDSTTVYAMGFPSDIDLTETLYTSLLIQMVQAGDAYIKSGEYKQEKVWVPGKYKKVNVRRSYWGGMEWDDEYVPGHEKPVDARTARRSFYDGFIQRVTLRLRTAAMEAKEAAEAEGEASGVVDTATGQTLSSTALVLREKSKEIDAFYDNRAKGIRGSWGGERRARGSATSSVARKAGSAAGEKARISGQGSLPAGRGKIGA